MRTLLFQRSKKGPALSGGMDWWRMEWSFSRVRKIFFRGRNFQENPRNSGERAIFAKFQALKFENSEPEKMQFHTPSHSIPPLDSLLKKGLAGGGWWQTVSNFAPRVSPRVVFPFCYGGIGETRHKGGMNVWGWKESRHASPLFRPNLLLEPKKISQCSIKSQRTCRSSRQS